MRRALALVGAPYREDFIFPDDDTGPYFACNGCGKDVTEEPCPEHAPTGAPGLRLVDCDATPRHIAFVHDRDDYGAMCPYCVLGGYMEREQLAQQCRHWRWRRTWLVRWLTRKACTLGVISGFAIRWGNGCDRCYTFGRAFRGRRLYILGVKREVWRCWRRGHRRGVEVGLGFCGKCIPWPCCDSVTEGHADGCVEGFLRQPEQVTG